MRTVSVTMTEGSWSALLELTLAAAVRLHHEGRQEAAHEALTGLVPVLAHAGGSKALEQTERAVRARVGSYVSSEVRRAAGRLVILAGE